MKWQSTSNLITGKLIEIQFLNVNLVGDSPQDNIDFYLIVPIEKDFLPYQFDTKSNIRRTCQLVFVGIV